MQNCAGKWIKLESIILREVSQAQKAKCCMFSLIYGIQTYYKYSNEKHVTLRGGHIQEGKVKEEVKKVNMVDVLPIQE
jgi:hypothetical protein